MTSYPATDPRHTAHRRPPIGDHPLDEYAVAARRHALDLEEEGLAGLVPVDRILATVGGLIGGVLTFGVALGWAAARDASRTRVRRRKAGR